MQERRYFVYIMTNPGNTVLYTGVTNDVSRRLQEHREAPVDSFTKKYHIEKLVYVETSGDIYTAIAREKQIKAGSRRKKVELVERQNPKWMDLANSI